jgi:hypothetical protein
MRLARITEAFDQADWWFELKSNGFRALAHVAGHRRQRVSGMRHIPKSWPELHRTQRTATHVSCARQRTSIS